MNYKGKTNHRNVNSKLLIEDMELLMRGALNNIGFDWNNQAHQEALLDLVDDLLYKKKEERKIYNYKFYSDNRNNSPDQVKNGTRIVTIKFRQVDCINQTILEYIFTPHNDEDGNLVEF